MVRKDSGCAMEQHPVIWIPRVHPALATAPREDTQADGINRVSSWELILRWRKQPADEQVKVSKDKEHVLQGEGALYLLDAPSTAQLSTNFILIWSNFKTPSGPALFSSGHAEDFTKAKEKLVFQK